MRTTLILVCALAALLVGTDAYNIRSADGLTTSGLSAGGFMASQFHVAYSSRVKGAAIFAGGPYYCATGLENMALTRCMSMPDTLVAEELVLAADGFADAGTIDHLKNLKDSRVYAFSGTEDTVVATGVMRKLVDWYHEAAGIDVVTEFSIAAEHTLPTLNFGRECDYLGDPYINKCDYDGAGEAFKVIFDDLKPKGTPLMANVRTFDQHKFVPEDRLAVGLAETGYVYVPTACQKGVECRVHVSWHGCTQQAAIVDNKYYFSGGFNDWAETNNIIVIYPQSKENLLLNPKACFDWWGYSGPDYALKSAPQMRMVMNLIEWLESHDL